MTVDDRSDSNSESENLCLKMSDGSLAVPHFHVNMGQL